jgi:hypothetical protein
MARLWVVLPVALHAILPLWSAAAEMVRIEDRESHVSFAYDPANWRDTKLLSRPSSRRAVEFILEEKFWAKCTLQAMRFDEHAPPMSVHQNLDVITDWFMRRLRAEYPDGRLISSLPDRVGEREAIRLKRSFTMLSYGETIPMLSDAVVSLSPTHDIILECVYVAAADAMPNFGDLMHRQIELILRSLKIAPDSSHAGLHFEITGAG